MKYTIEQLSQRVVNLWLDYLGCGGVEAYSCIEWQALRDIIVKEFRAELERRERNREDYMKPIMELIQTVGKLALEEGEKWRVGHPELMDAYQACLGPELEKDEAPKGIVDGTTSME